MSVYEWSAKKDDGTEVKLRLANGMITEVVDTPQPPPPWKPNTIKVGTASYPLLVDVPRGTDQMVMFINDDLYGGVNKWGVDILVDLVTMKVLDVRDREKATALPFTGNDLNHLIIAGNGKAAEWLRQHAKVGVGLSLLTQAVPPPVEPPVVSEPVYGEYMMDGSGKVDLLAPECNRLLVAFYQGTDLVEWGGDSPSKTATDINAWVSTRKQKGQIAEVVISLGGQGGKVNLDLVDEGMARISKLFPVDGIDFDAEAFGYTPAQALSVAKLSAAAVGKKPSDFIVQFVPPGGNPVAPALAAAVAVQAAGFKVYFGQQLYETTITDQDVISATQRAVTALGEKSVLIGIMLGDSKNSWTLDSADRRLRAVKAKWKNIGGMYVWESARANTVQLMRVAKSALG